MNHHILDARRLLCPMPVIKTQNLVATLPPGDTLEVVCTDPGATNDVPAWCRINGHKLLNISQRDNEYIIHIEVAKIEP